MQPPHASRGTVPRGFDVAGDLTVSALVRTRDGHGRRVLTTSLDWDRRGPRTIALAPGSERRLGRALAVVLLIALAGIATAMIDSDLFAAVLVLVVLAASSVATVAKGPVTRFLDTLAAG